MWRTWQHDCSCFERVRCHCLFNIICVDTVSRSKRIPAQQEQGSGSQPTTQTAFNIFLGLHHFVAVFQILIPLCTSLLLYNRTLYIHSYIYLNWNTQILTQKNTSHPRQGGSTLLFSAGQSNLFCIRNTPRLKWGVWSWTSLRYNNGLCVTIIQLIYTKFH